MLIAEIVKAENGQHQEHIQVNVQTYQSKRLCDCRVYYMDKAGEWKPTRKGLCVTLDTVDEMIAALTEAKRHLSAKPVEGAKIIRGWKAVSEFLGITPHQLRTMIVNDDSFPMHFDKQTIWQYEDILVKLRDGVLSFASNTHGRARDIRPFKVD